MPRQRSPSRDEAKRMYLDSKGKMLLKDIAKAVGKQDTQIRRWKSLDHWDEELKGNVTIPKDNVTKQNNGIEKPPKTELLPEEIETLNNEELTEKQRLFCLLEFILHHGIAFIDTFAFFGHIMISVKHIKTPLPVKSGHKAENIAVHSNNITETFIFP